MPQLRLCFLVTISVLITHIASAADDRPNIVIVMADDFGVGDIQAYYPDNKISGDPARDHAACGSAHS